MEVEKIENSDPFKIGRYMYDFDFSSSNVKNLSLNQKYFLSNIDKLKYEINFTQNTPDDESYQKIVESLKLSFADASHLITLN